MCILSEGRSVFFGSPDAVVPWFNSLGYSYTRGFSGSVPDFAIDLVRSLAACCHMAGARFRKQCSLIWLRRSSKHLELLSIVVR